MEAGAFRHVSKASFVSLFQMKISSFLQNWRGAEAPIAPTPTPCSGRENKKCSLLKVSLNITFIKNTSAYSYVRMHLVEKNKHLIVVQTLHYYNTKLIILFFIRSRNFYLRLGAQNVDTHTRLRLFLYLLPS